jgi:outer membrane murein-binding lipoprotein Lpp
MIPTPHRYALAAAALAGLYLAGYIHGRTSTRDELTAWQSVASATQTRYRTLEKETADAQAAHVKVWTAARDASRAEWVRIRAAGRDRVPKICSEPGGAAELAGDRLEVSRAEADRVLHDAVAALERADEVAATLEICQSELRQCAGLR